MSNTATQVSELSRMKLQEKALLELLTRLNNYKHKLQLEEMRLQSMLGEQRKHDPPAQFNSNRSQHSFDPQPTFTDSADDSTVPPSLEALLERSFQ